jgi:hypothetical protein
VREHFEIGDERGPVRSRVVKGLLHLLLPYRARFRALVETRIPATLRRQRRGAYDLVLVNDIDLLPWVVDEGPRLLRPDPAAKIHLDLHEYHTWSDDSADRITGLLLRGYHRWMTGLLTSDVFASRSTVATGIAELYARERGIPEPSIVRNSPGYVEQEPTPVDPARIDLVFHGNAELSRGLPQLAEAMTLLEPRFHLNLMLTGLESVQQEMRRMTAGMEDRVTYHDPVPMAEVAHRLNEWDLEVIFYPPSTPNYLYSLPNKFFEAVQGRLGVVTGESPSLSELIRRFGNGVVLQGWTGVDLAAGLNGLTAEQITAMKAAAVVAAHELNADRERDAFLAGIAPADSERRS